MSRDPTHAQLGVCPANIKQYLLPNAGSFSAPLSSTMDQHLLNHRGVVLGAVVEATSLESRRSRV